MAIEHPPPGTTESTHRALTPPRAETERGATGRGVRKPGRREARHDTGANPASDHGHAHSDGHDPHHTQVPGHDQHGHHDDHTPEVGHDHDHGSGLPARLLSIFGHSHAPHEKVDSALASNDRGIWAVKVSLVALAITAALQLVVALASGSVGLLADTIHNVGDAATSVPLWIAFALAKRGANRRYSYGYGRIEDIAGVIVVLLILVSAGVAAYESVMKLVHPQPIEHIGWVAVAALVGCLGNELVAVFRIRIGREIGSAALVADGYHARVDGFTSLAVLIGVGGVALGVPILDPLVGLLITAAILFIVRDAAIAVWHRLVDVIDPELLSQISAAAAHADGVRAVERVRARWLGHRLVADLDVAVDPGISVEAGHRIAHDVAEELRAHIPAFGEAQVHVHPYTPGRYGPAASSRQVLAADGDG